MTDKKYERYYDLAGKASMKNCGAISLSNLCGCYHCCRIFPHDEVTEFIDDVSTAMCPYCGVDAVIGDLSGVPLRKDVLEELHERWFSIEEEPPCIGVVSDDCGGLILLLEHCWIETVSQESFIKEQPAALPNFYCFRGAGAENRHMASWFKSHGVPVVWYPLSTPTDEDSECAGMSDVTILTGRESIGARPVEGAAGLLVILTLGKYGLLYRLRDGAWSVLHLNSGVECDFDKATDYIAASVAFDLFRGGGAFESLQEDETENILSNAMHFVVEAVQEHRIPQYEMGKKDFTDLLPGNWFPVTQ